MMDTNNDGFVSLAELEAFVDHALEHLDEGCGFADIDEVFINSITLFKSLFSLQVTSKQKSSTKR